MNPSGIFWYNLSYQSEFIPDLCFAHGMLAFVIPINKLQLQIYSPFAILAVVPKCRGFISQDPEFRVKAVVLPGPAMAMSFINKPPASPALPDAVSEVSQRTQKEEILLFAHFYCFKFHFY